MENKKILRSTLIAFALWLVAAIITGIVGVTSLTNGGVSSNRNTGELFTYGFRACMQYYCLMWRPSQFTHFTAYIGVVLVFVAITLGIATLVMALVKKKPAFLLTALVETVAFGFLAFIVIFAIIQVEYQGIRALGILLLGGATGLNLFAIYFATLPVLKMFAGMLDKAAGYEKENCCCEGGIGEEDVRAIVKEGLDEHVEEYHAEKEEEPAPAPAPVKEPEPEPEPEPEEEPEEEEEDEEEEEEAPAEVGPDGLVIKGKRKRKPFETRLRNSEYDLRHKYYDLRDYIKWYGLRNRVSIPGDTFSYKRQRYAFVTIVGKHLRIYLQLDPKDYADSTIPVEQAEAKKYEDLPCLLRIKSDLAYRRAKKLVDDLMAKIGMERPEGDEPKETQKKD